MTVHRNGVSVPEAVREILTRNYPVYQCLKMKLMNFHSLAEFIQPQVQQLSGKEASINTLVVAIKRFSDAAGELSEFPHIFPLSNSIKLILPGEDYALVQKKMEHLKEVVTQANVSKLTLNLSPRAEMTPGIASYITELLFRNGVNILDAFLGYGDIIMVVDDKDGPLAYDILQREIHGSNQLEEWKS